MKTITAFLFLFVAIAQGFAGEISPDDAKNHVGETVTISGLVSEVKVSSKAIFLDMGGKYPDEQFTIVYFEKKLIPALRELVNKNIKVSGTVVLYEGRPEIVLESMSQISK